MTKTLTYIVAGVGVLVVLVFTTWFFFYRTTSQTPLIPADAGFGIGDSRTVTVPNAGDTQNGVVAAAIERGPQKVFKVADGPVTSATLVQTLHPTTTLARYVLQENGHVFDLVLESAGAVPRALSNTTIPGGARGVWAESGQAVILRYMDAAVVKSVYLGFPTTTSATGSQTSSAAPVRIKFFPDNIADLAASPDGKSVVYLLRTSAGSDAYTAKSDGTGGKKLFSVPFWELLVSWPAPNTQLVWTKSKSGVPGAAFSVNAEDGGVTPLLYAPGLTVTADRSFAHVIYQTTSAGASSYVHNVKTGEDTSLSFEPTPERCVWSSGAASVAYCATPLEAVPAGYLDLWHRGMASMVDSIVLFNFSSGGSEVVTTPGSADGGVASDIAEMAVSPDDRYLLFIKKGDRSLWGVQLY